MTRKERAINSIEFSRKTHLDWAEWFDKHPEDERRKVAGDSFYHRQAVAEYDNVLIVLRMADG